MSELLLTVHFVSKQYKMIITEFSAPNSSYDWVHRNTHFKYHLFLAELTIIQVSFWLFHIMYFFYMIKLVVKFLRAPTHALEANASEGHSEEEFQIPSFTVHVDHIFVRTPSDQLQVFVVFKGWICSHF